MIAWLEGNLREKAPTRIVLDVRGVGYELIALADEHEKGTTDEKSHHSNDR